MERPGAPAAPALPDSRDRRATQVPQARRASAGGRAARARRGARRAGPGRRRGTRRTPGPAGATGPRRAPGSAGPKGDPGSGLAKFEDLNGLPCTAGTPGTIAVSYDARATRSSPAPPPSGQAVVRVNEFMTGVTGAATNEFVEIVNAGSGRRTSRAGSSSTARRRARATPSSPRSRTARHSRRSVLPVRRRGYTAAPAADQRYSTGSRRRRRRGHSRRDGTLVDSVGRATATNASSRGSAPAAPPTTAAPGRATFASPTATIRTTTRRTSRRRRLAQHRSATNGCVGPTARPLALEREFWRRNPSSARARAPFPRSTSRSASACADRGGTDEPATRRRCAANGDRVVELEWPQPTCAVLLLRVLRVVEEHVGALRERRSRRSSRASAAKRPSAGSWSGRYARTCPSLLDPVADRRAGMAHGRGDTVGRRSRHGVRRHVVEDELRREVARSTGNSGGER